MQRSFFELDWLGRSRVVNYARILFVTLALSTYKPFRDATGSVGSDFYAFWAAGRLALAGKAEQAYDVAAIAHVQATTGWGEVMAFVNPPAMFLFVAPLGGLSFAWGWIVWVLLSFTAWFLATRQFAPKLVWPIAAYPDAALAAWHAQTGLLTGGLLAAGTALLSARPFVAGLLFGVLIIKPHLAILIPVALLAGRHWYAIVGAAVSAIGLNILAAAIFGFDALSAYPSSWETSKILMANGGEIFFLRFATVYGFAHVIFGDPAAIIVQLAVSSGVAVVTWKVWASSAPMEGKIALLLSATPLATPYLFNYDLPFLIVPVIWLYQRWSQRGFRPWDKIKLALLYIAPFTCRTLALPIGMNFTPLAIGALLVLVHLELRERPSALPAPGSAKLA